MVPTGNKAKTPFVGQPFCKNNSSSSSSSPSEQFTDFIQNDYTELESILALVAIILTQKMLEYACISNWM